MVFPNLPSPCLLPDSLSPSLSLIMFLGQQPDVPCNCSLPKRYRKSVRAASCRWGGSGDVAGRGRRPGCRPGGGFSLQPGPGSQPTGHSGQRPSPDVGPGPGRGPSAGHSLGKSGVLRPGSGHRLTPGRPQLHVSMASGALHAQQPLPGLPSGPATPGPAHLNTGAQAPGGGRRGLAGGPASVPDRGRGWKAWERQPGRTQRRGPRHVWGNWHMGTPGGKVRPPRSPGRHQSLSTGSSELPLSWGASQRRCSPAQPAPDKAEPTHTCAHTHTEPHLPSSPLVLGASRFRMGGAKAVPPPQSAGAHPGRVPHPQKQFGSPWRM